VGAAVAVVVEVLEEVVDVVATVEVDSPPVAAIVVGTVVEDEDMRRTESVSDRLRDGVGKRLGQAWFLAKDRASYVLLPFHRRVLWSWHVYHMASLRVGAKRGSELGFLWNDNRTRVVEIVR
jgi:hypothetical protein